MPGREACNPAGADLAATLTNSRQSEPQSGPALGAATPPRVWPFKTWMGQPFTPAKAEPQKKVWQEALF